MLLIEVNNELIGVWPGDEDDDALDWLRAQVDLDIEGEYTYDEESGAYTIGEYTIVLWYCDGGTRL